MKKIYIFITFLLFYAFVAISNNDDDPVKWYADLNEYGAFVENNGQIEEIKNADVLYHLTGVGVETYFTRESFILRMDTLVTKEPPASAEFNRNEVEEERENSELHTSYVEANFININPDVKIIPLDKVSWYFTYGMKPGQYHGYKKLLYKNAYPNIDLLFYVPSDSSGFKYKILLHPGADLSQVKIKYGRDIKKLELHHGNLYIYFKNGALIKDYTPNNCYLQDGTPIQVHFKISGNIVSFVSSKISFSQEAVVDPWIDSGNEHYAFEADYDYDGNVYIYDDNSYTDKILKYSPTGSLQWVHNVTAISTSYEGNLMVDRNMQKIYISEGFNSGGARTYRIDFNGNSDGFMSNSNSSFREMWCMAFDCGSGSVMGFGGGTNSNLNGGLINPNSGSVQTANFTGSGNTDQDIVDAVTDNFGNLFCVYAHVSGYCDHYLLKVNSSMNGHDWMIVHSLGAFEECSNHPPQYSCWSSGNQFNALAVNDDYLYLYTGAKIGVYDKAAGTELNVISTGSTAKQVGGIAVDDCNNIYVGANGSVQVYQYDGSSISGPIDNISVGSGEIYDVTYDKNYNLLYIAAHGYAAVITANHSVTCSSNTFSVDNDFFCTGNGQVNVVSSVNTTMLNPLINYTWLDQNNNIIQQSGDTYELADTLFNIGFGNIYRIKVQLNPPCGPILWDSIIIPAAITDTIYPTMVNCYGENNGAARVEVQEGIGPYNYQWSSGDNDSIANTLVAGTYYVTINGGCGLSTTDSVSITQPPELITSISDFDSVLCYGDNNGTATVLAQGGTPSYTYQWDDGETNSNAVNLLTGQHNVTVTDSHGCTSVSQVIIPTPAPLAIVLDSITNVSCYGLSDGAIDITIHGGTPPYTYQWSNGITTEDNHNIPAGVYYLTVTDYHNCQVADSFEVTQPDTLSSSFTSVTPVLCYGGNTGQAHLIVTGGTSPYSYLWDDSYTEPNNDSLYAGSHIVTITDAYGCQNIDTVVITQPLPLSAAIDSTVNVLCYGGNDGFARCVASGGVPPYTYLWDGGANTESVDTLMAGYHSVTVTDYNGCVTTTDVNIGQPPLLELSMPSSYDVCHGQYQDVICSVTGGTPPYSYYWNGVEGDSLLTIHPDADYDITAVVTDSHGCTDSLTTHIYVSTPLSVTLISNRDSVCPSAPVMFAASFSGGAGEPYTIILDGDTVQSLPQILHIHHSHYVVLDVTDKCGSEDRDSIYIYVYPIPQVRIFSDTSQGCVPLLVNFNLSILSDSMGINSYIWSFGDNENLSTSSHPSHTYTRSGIFDVWVQCITEYGCKTGDTIPEMIDVYPKPHAEYAISPRVVNILAPEIHFINQSEGNVLNLWSFGDGDSATILSPFHRYPQVAAHYLSQLIIENDYGCRDTAEKDIYIEDVYTFWAPTAFSPDGDGQNDFFLVRGYGISPKGFVLYIYDRWGELVSTINDFYPQTHSSGKWDGTIKGDKKGANGVYKWVCKFKDVAGNDHTETGNVLLIR